MLPSLTRNAGPGGPTHERVAYQRQRIRANALRPSPLSSGHRQDLGSGLHDRDRVLEVRGHRSIRRHDRPVVVVDPSREPAEGEHRLDRGTEPRLKLPPWPAGPVVRDLGLLVHRRADAVADELPDDPEACAYRDRLDS